MSTTWKSERARIASLSRSRPADDPDLIEARRNMRAERTAEYIKNVLAQRPPLTDQQRTRLAELLRPARQSVPGGAA
ncbi:hypothetical protein A5649_09765 [Mycolicibacter heraklionensis]|uniref:PhiRv1 phage protein n=1 Tax=Mycolicibacter heraklionensis TaxID=512402 RepID=A0AA91EX68_9MYCO|nr:hypothetical protein [Mycolicibacter heraklionensis]OBK82133.1 hypothetical protein A5649_09765 [Mycolicibacter heraklionensis]